MKSYKIFVALLGATLMSVSPAFAETSAFDAGKVDAKTPYGLTKNEKVLLDNKEKLQTLDTKVATLNSSQEDLKQSLDGVKSVVEGVNSQYSKLNTQVPKLKSQLRQMDENLSSEINHLRDYIKESRKIQESNYAQIKLILDELSKLVDKINTNYVSRQNLIAKLKETKISTLKEVADAAGKIAIAKAVAQNDATISKPSTNSQEEIKKETKQAVSKADVNATTSKELANTQESTQASVKPEAKPEVKADKKPEVKKDDSWKKEGKKAILKLAIKQVEEKKFDLAKEKLEYLIKHKYSRATSNFYLGEINYQAKDYTSAIDYYKKSSGISTKTWFMPKLLYHTAISLDKLGDKKSANQFYKALKHSYPKSREAKASPSRK